MRKIVFKFPLLLLFAFILLLAACGGSNEEADSEGKKSADSQNSSENSDLAAWGKEINEQFSGEEINLAFASHPSTDSFQQMTKDFEKLTGIKVRWEVMEQTYLKNKQLMDFTSKTGTYDVLMVDNFWGDEYVTKKVIEPLDSYLEDESLTPEWFNYEDIVPAYRNGFTKFDGKTYGIPTAGETRFIGYRTDLFEKYDKEPPKTMAEFKELAEFFNGKEDDLYGVSMRAQRGIHFASGLMSVLYNFSDGFFDQETGEILMDDPKTVEALQFYVDMLKLAPPDVASYTHEEALSAFMSGKSAMWLDATAIAPQILDPEKSSIADNVAFVPTPEGPAGRASALAGWSMAIPETSKKKEAAWAFIVYMNSEAMSELYMANGGVPVRTSQFEAAGDGEKLNPIILEALEDANALVERGISWVPPSPNLGQILDRVGYYGSMALSDEISVEEASIKAQKEIEDIGID
ncbi:ABC transporter substrate-binding protein [Pseudogracilibacillus auburnensis]|uniref:Multiple sugar transport system substrate-binding protein n=1 Tax=Pseudogracilibacillus auburnensis TaxID=1494959 RepID=A0A2V3W5N2_9BACI|nr:sugar ABC transporter substrate-binding protein [Pseudogracilibacillus auburnensis]PXW89422.1 multiple sugar transport system substrate-binding protein [Pseudogracilibacillus auburnensis]